MTMELNWHLYLYALHRISTVLRLIQFGMFADTVSFSLQSYQISHTTVSMKSIGDE